MAYILREIVLGNTPYSDEDFRKIWQDIAEGRVPLLFDSDGKRDEGAIPVTRYDAVSPSGAGRISIVAVGPEFFAQMEQGVQDAKYRKFQAVHHDSVQQAAQDAWEEVRREFESGMLQVQPDGHFEATVPAELSPDGQAHASVYMALRTVPGIE